MPERTYDQLTFKDDFMFCKVLQHNPELCKELLELILGDAVGDLVELHQQETVRITEDRKGVRFDVFAKDDRSVIYDIEMQNISEADLSRRIRYSQSLMDLEQLERGAHYYELGKSYVIYICNFRLFADYGLHRYSFRNLCVEDNHIELEDGTEKIFLCTKGDANDTPEKLACFLSFVAGQKASDDFTRKLDDAIITARRNARWRKEYMDLQDHIDLAWRKGIEEGQNRERANTEKERIRADAASAKAEKEYALRLAIEKENAELRSRLDALSDKS